MPFGPVFRHEMLAAGRKRRYFWVRTLVGLGMLLLLATGYLTVVSTGASGGGRLSISDVARLTEAFYVLFAWSTMIGVLMLTPAIAAGAIAMERERRTIEYLFATDLSNAEIVLDKLAARLLTIGALVLATLPVLAIFRLLGGVSWALLMTHFAMLASTATLAAAIALTVGVWCERGRDAVPRAEGAVFLWIVALPLAMLVNTLLQFSSTPSVEWFNQNLVVPLIQGMAAVHPLMLLLQSSGPAAALLGVDLDRWAALRMVLLHLAAAAALVGLSVAMVRRVHLRAAARPGARQIAGGRASPSRSPYEKRPMLWKEFFAASVRKSGSKWAARVGLALLLLAIGGPLLTILYNAIKSGWQADFEAYMGVATGISTACGSILVLLIGSRAAGLVTYEHERDTLTPLLSTPLESADIVLAKTLGNLYAFRWGLAGLLLIPLMGSFLELTALKATIGVAASLAVLSWAATAVGLAVSMRMKSSIKAIVVTMLLMLSIGLFYSLLAMSFAGLTGANNQAFALFVFPPLAPYLIAFPIIATVESAPPASYIASYAIGLVFYAVLGLVVTMNNLLRFDRVTGRSA